VLIGSSKATQVSAVARADTGDEEAHWHCRLLLWLLRLQRDHSGAGECDGN
jgi:hypothetical protein